MNSKQSLKKRVLMTFGTLGVAAAVAGGGTFATFNAQTTNPGNTFATGTLVMSNKVNALTACLSTGAGTTTDTNSFNCDTAFNLTAKKPGDSGTANITIKNEGSIAATALKLFSAACTNADAAGETYHGTGSTCGSVQFYVQQYSDAFTTVSSCLYGGTTVANTCDFSNASKTLADFVSNYPNAGGGLGAGALASGSSSYFTIGVKMPLTADNTVQGRKASIDLTWFMS
jgi:predicted ribosomally synthesized peptide with SipW-like signal peptide